MAFTQQEQELINWGLDNGKSKDEVRDALINLRAGVKPLKPADPIEDRSVIKDLGIGAAKGLGDTVHSLGRMGRAIQAGVDPTRTLADYDKEANAGEISPFSGQQSRDIQETLKSDNKTQMVGKGLEILGEIMFPVGAASRALGLTEKGARAVGASVDNAMAKASNIGDEVLESGENAKDWVFQTLGGLDDKTKTALERTPKDVWDKYLDLGRKAMTDDRNRTPLESVGDDIIGGLKQLKRQTDQFGQVKSRVLDSANVGFQKVGDIAQKTSLNIQKQFSDMKLDPKETNFINEFQQELMLLGKNPRLREVDQTIDLLQDKIYKSGLGNAIEVTDRVTGALRMNLGKLNSEIKKLGGKAYSDANKQYADAIELVNEVNRRLGKKGASAGSFVKRLFSPSDARTKELFENLQKYTGADYFRDARIAKFVMEALGDNRSKSLLDEIPSPNNIMKAVVDWTKDRLELPIRGAESFIKKSGKVNKAPNQPGAMMGAVGGAVPGEDGEMNPLEMAIGASLGKFATTPQKKEAYKLVKKLSNELDKLAGKTFKSKKAQNQQMHRMKTLQDGINHQLKKLLD